jgi:hypothetical protein
VPHGAARQAAIHQHYYEVLTPEERNDPLWDPDNWDPDNEDHWTAFFTERHNMELAHYEGTSPPLANKNAVARKLGRPRPHPHLVTRPHRRGQQPAAYNADAELDAAQDGWHVVVLAFFLVNVEDSARRRHRHRVAAKAPSTQLLRPKKKLGVMPGFLSRVKKEPGASAPPSSKKARHLAKDAAL